MHREPQPQPQGLEEMVGTLSAGQAETVASLGSARRCLLCPRRRCRIFALIILQTLLSFAWQSEGQVRAEGVFVLRLSDHLPPLLTGPKFFPVLGDEGDEEEVDPPRQRGKDGASVFKPGTPSGLAEGTVRRAKGSKASYARCARPRLRDGGSLRQFDRMGQAASPSGESPHQAVEPNTTAAVLPDGLASRLAIPASWARVTSRGGPPEDAWSQNASSPLSRSGDVPA